MKTNLKRLSAVLGVLALVVGLVLPAMADDTSSTANSTGTSVQITKTLKIGQGITVPSENFQFVFASATTEEADALGETGSYIVPGATQAGGGRYPDLSSVTVDYNSELRKADGTDEELTFMSPVIDLADSSLVWEAPGLYIYSVNETPGNTAGMTYDSATYFLKVYVKNGDNGAVVDSVAVYGKNDENKWVKIEGAPTDTKEPGTSGKDDGSDDYAGNAFRFINSYQKLVDEHPTNPNETSGDDTTQNSNPAAFKLTKDVSGNYANKDYGFDFKVKVHLPATYNDYTPIMATVNGYTANLINNKDYADDELGTVTLIPDTEYIVYLKHADSFAINELPAGATVEVKEEPSGMKYVPTYLGKWGGDLSIDREGRGDKGTELATDTIVVGENGAYVQFTNTLNDSDVTATGIVIGNLPYILMVLIALAGIGFLMVGKKRRHA